MNKKLRISIIITATAIVVASIIITWFFINREEPTDGRAMLEKGISEVNRNNLPLAFSSLQQAITALKEENDSDRLFEASVYIALVYDQIGRRDRAYDILKKTSFRDVPNYKDYASQYYLRLMGHYKTMLDKDYKAAEWFTRRAIEFSKEKYPDDASYMYVDIANLAEIYITSGHPEKARRLLDSLESLKKMKYDKSMRK